MLRVNGQFNIDTNIAFGDKSIMHRALILASIAQGESTIHNAVINQDTQATIDCLTQLGAKFLINGNTVKVTPISKLPQNKVMLDCKNSGTTARLLAGLVCGLNVNATFVGDNSLSRRPMDRVIQPLQQMGADIVHKDDCLFQVKAIDHPLVGIDYTLSVPSAQVKSAILIAGLFAKGYTIVRESKLSRNHTELLMQFLQCDIQCENGNNITVAKSVPLSKDIYIPNDISTAVYLIVAGIKSGITLHNVGLNVGRCGALKALQRADIDLQIVNKKVICGELCGDIVVKPTKKLSPIVTQPQDSATLIDEVPLLALVACMAQGQSIFYDVGELQHKESNRIKSIIDMVSACQGQAYFDNGNLYVNGNQNNLPELIKIHTYNDHRIAMCGVVASVFNNSTIVDNEQCIAVSCANFLEILGVNSYKFALVGSDIASSLSPLLMCVLAHNADVNLSYTLCDLPKDIDDKGLITTINSYDGVNVTMPFKQRVAKLYNAKLDSVNTVGRNIVPASTDGYGFIKALQSHDIDVNNKSILVVGAGGASRAIVNALLQHNARVNIVNRTASKEIELAKQYNIDYKLTQFDGIVSTIPMCEYENTIELSDSVQFVFSAEYKEQSNLIARAKEKGIVAIDGLAMLYWQGVKSFELWTGKKVKNCYSQFVQLANEIFKR